MQNMSRASGAERRGASISEGPPLNPMARVSNTSLSAQSCSRGGRKKLASFRTSSVETGEIALSGT